MVVSLRACVLACSRVRVIRGDGVMDLKDMMEGSTFSVDAGRYVYAKVRAQPASTENHLMIFTDQDEITIVTEEGNLPSLDLIERNKDTHKVFALNVAVPFYSVGFLAEISKAIAAENINSLIISTYSKDYFLIKEDCAERVEEVLVSLGLKRLCS